MGQLACWTQRGVRRFGRVREWITADAPLGQTGEAKFIHWRPVGGRWSPVETRLEEPTRFLKELARPTGEASTWLVMLGSAFAGVCEPRLRATSLAKHGPLLCAARVEVGDVPAEGDFPPIEGGTFNVGHFRSRTGRESFVRSVARALEYIRAGDIYQVNLTHRLEADFHGSPRVLFSALLDAAQPEHAFYAEIPTARGFRVVASGSPELFLRYDVGTRAVETRPMKGTAPPGLEVELRESRKELAELSMIVDLMRNDLGRVCEPASVRVRSPRFVERIGAGIMQASAIVEGVLPERRGAADLILAAFPPGSVIGCPKIRAAEVIAEQEGDPRGLYCGALGHIAPDGSMELSVAIRTAVIDLPTSDGGCADSLRGSLSLGVGAGIVFGSDPEAEWRETLLKASAFTTLSSAASREIAHA